MIKRKNKILNKFMEDPAITQIKLIEELGYTRKQIQKDVKELKEKGLLAREGSNRNGKWIVKKQEE